MRMQQALKEPRVIVSNQEMSEKQITARVRDIKQEDIGIFRVELVAEAHPDPRGFEVIRHPIQ
jgi:hypothetical protein